MVWGCTWYRIGLGVYTLLYSCIEEHVLMYGNTDIYINLDKTMVMFLEANIPEVKEPFQQYVLTIQKLTELAPMKYEDCIAYQGPKLLHRLPPEIHNIDNYHSFQHKIVVQMLMLILS